MTIKRIIEVTKNYAIRHFLKGENLTRPFVKDVSDFKFSRITQDTRDEDIESILFCDFHETKSMAYNTVQFFKEHPHELITDHKIPVNNFKYWYGINNNNKLIVGELNELDNDMVVIPVRNIKSNIQKPFNNIITKNGILYCVNEDGDMIEVPYVQTSNNIGKCIFISKDGHSLFVYGVRSINKNEIECISNFLQTHPSYPILVDNGRYLFYFFGDAASKEAFCCGGFAEIEEMYTIGSIKK